MNKLIAFDCDSTLSAIEGVDELARLAGDDVFRQVEDLTNQAMNGEIPIEEIFARRLELINPTRQQCVEIGKAYLKEIEPTAKETISKLKKGRMGMYYYFGRICYVYRGAGGLSGDFIY